MDTSLTYSGNIVRQHDRDRFLASLCVPHTVRPSLWALGAFNYEIAKTREVVTNTTLGLIRLQWWRDALDAFYNTGKGPDHAIFNDLALAIRHYALPKESFERLLYAREFDLEDMAPENLQGLENYADFTGTPLFELALRIAGEGYGQAQSIAKAYSLTGLLRAVPFHAGQGRCFLPQDLLALEGLSPQLIYDGKIDGIENVTRKVAERARALLPDAKPGGRLGRVTRAQALLWLDHLHAVAYNPFAVKAQFPPPFYALRCWLKSF